MAWPYHAHELNAQNITGCLIDDGSWKNASLKRWAKIVQKEVGHKIPVDRIQRLLEILENVRAMAELDSAENLLFEAHRRHTAGVIETYIARDIVNILPTLSSEQIAKI